MFIFIFIYSSIQMPPSSIYYYIHFSSFSRSQDCEAPSIAPDAFRGLEVAAERRQADKTAVAKPGDQQGSMNQQAEAHPGSKKYSFTIGRFCSV
jgi:hypothetical protein